MPTACRVPARHVASRPRRILLLFLSSSEGLRRENRQPSEDSFCESFPLFNWEFQVPLHFLFHLLNLLGKRVLLQPTEQQLMCTFLLHHFHSIQYLPVRSSFPNRQDHRLS